ncbi:MAG: magnesium transporter CorA family protein [Christensenellales bacterium]
MMNKDGMNMFYRIENGKTIETDLKNAQISCQNQYYGYFSFDHIEQVVQKLGIDGKLVAESVGYGSMTYENHDCFDFICLNILDRDALYIEPDRICIYVLKNMLLFFSKNDAVLQRFLHDAAKENNANISFNRLLSNFFEKLTADDVDVLEKIEQEISDLESELIESKKRNCVKEIISLRKRLMALKRYYEQLLNVLDELMENENDLLNEHTLRYFKIFEGKVERLYHNILNLRDYVTQVREAYQAEVDIGLNNIMKIFTVLTAIFLPLTLLVGWYGMNLRMPEFQWNFGYPMVIIIAVLIVAFCLYYFKKNKWF